MKNATKLILTLILVLTPFTFLFADVIVINELDARKQAAMAVISRVAFETPLLEEWKDATLGDQLVLFDASRRGQASMPLVYDFEVVVNNEISGWVRVPATSLFGTTALSLNLGTRNYDIEQRLDQAVDMVKEKYAYAEVLSVLPVVHQYRKIAAMIDVELGWPAGVYKIFIEIPSMKIVHDDVKEYAGYFNFKSHINLDCRDAAPGAGRIYYYHDSVPADLIDQRNELFEEEWEVVSESLITLNQTFDIDPYLGTAVLSYQWPMVKDVLQGLSWLNEDEAILPTYKCKLIKQEVWDWCARAAAHMITWYFNGALIHTQTQTDNIMNSYGWNTNWRKAQLKYYTKDMKLANSYYDPNIDTSTMKDPGSQLAGFLNYRAQINAGYPVCDGVTFHARMGMAYSVYEHGQFTQYDIGIYDPAQGSVGVYWELGWKDGMFGMFQVAPRYFLLYPRP